MNKEFQTLRKKQRFGLRKLNIGVASVLLGFTIFGFNLASQAPVAHADTNTVTTASAGSGASGKPELIRRLLAQLLNHYVCLALMIAQFEQILGEYVLSTNQNLPKDKVDHYIRHTHRT